MENIISLLKSNVQGISLEETVLDLNNKNECITSFLAILELLKLNLIRVNQSEKFSNIYIFLRGQ
jgi:chromatin segregation and condensation protein Rec8/ScpA/Scc1 (kleisin family)